MFEQILSVLQRDLESCRVTADPAALERARRDIPRRIPSSGLGEEASARLLFDTIAPALAAGQAGPHYYGFVTGGRTPISLAADCLVSSYDANVQVHLPEVTLATEIEQVAADLVLDLLGISPSHFPGRSITTGATASNILGLALGRQFAISRVLGEKYDVAEEGFGGVEIDIFAAGAHASIRKAAALVGIGRNRVVDLTDAQATDGPVAFDLSALEERMKEARASGRGVIVCPSYGEVNTGAFTPDMQRIRELCDKYGAWLHLDAAFGAFAVLHPDFEAEVRAGLQLADSLTIDAHKWLNVPYDCALFYARSSTIHAAVMGPGGEAPAYLSATAASIPSPLNTRIENSARFRALPLYASLVCYGRSGYEDIVRRNIAFAREVEAWLIASPHYDVLTPPSTSSGQAGRFRLLNIVLFAPARTCGVKRFEDAETGGQEMVKSINATGEIYVTGTKWKGRSVARLAVSNHLTGQSDGGAHFKAVVSRLEAIVM